MNALNRISKILFLVAGILSILLIVSYFALIIVFFVLGSPMVKEWVIESIENGTIQTNITGATSEEIATTLQLIYIGLAIMFIFFMAFSIVNTVLCFSARKKESTGLFVANIVFGLICGCEVNLVGAILGLIANSHKPKEIN